MIVCHLTPQLGCERPSHPGVYHPPYPELARREPAMLRALVGFNATLGDRRAEASRPPLAPAPHRASAEHVAAPRKAAASAAPDQTARPASGLSGSSTARAG